MQLLAIFAIVVALVLGILAFMLFAKSGRNFTIAERFTTALVTLGHRRRDRVRLADRACWRCVVNWRERTEQASYRVVFLPDNRTLSADMIAGVRLLQPEPASAMYGHDGFPQRVLIDTYRLSMHGQRCAALWGDWINDESGDVFAVLSEAHVRAQSRGRS